jgi:hypothetical protein
MNGNADLIVRFVFFCIADLTLHLVTRKTPPPPPPKPQTSPMRKPPLKTPHPHRTLSRSDTSRASGSSSLSRRFLLIPVTRMRGRGGLRDPSDSSPSFAAPSTPTTPTSFKGGSNASEGACVNGERGKSKTKKGEGEGSPSASSSTRAPRRGRMLRWGWGGRRVRLARRLLRVL